MEINYVVIFTSVVIWYVVNTRAPLVNIAIKLRLQKWYSGPKQMFFVGKFTILQFAESIKMLFGWHQSITYDNSYKMTTS